MADKDICKEEIKKLKKLLSQAEEIDTLREKTINVLGKVINKNKLLISNQDKIKKSQDLKIRKLQSKLENKDIWIYGLGGLSIVLTILLIIK